MEELQFAVEDVKLMNAMSDEPRPTQPWRLPPDEEINEYIHGLDAEALSLHGICGNCLGFYLFRRHLCEQGEKVCASFLMDVALYKKKNSQQNRLDQARKIYSNYLKAGAEFQERKAPISLFRNPNISESSSITSENWAKFIEPQNEESEPINFQGSVFKRVLDFMQENDSDKHEVEPLKSTFFDELELVVFYRMRDKYFSSFQKSAHYSKYMSFMSMSSAHVKQEDFSLFRVLGRGGFGIVYGCKKCQSGHLYALKVMDRKRIKARRAADLCITERNLMTMLDSPFIVALKYAYETPTEVHLVLDIMTGGDLGYHLRRKGIFNKDESLYYICRTILGIKTLHSYNIIYRDLKPDNILMDSRGRTALSDLGLAVVMPRNGITGACGTRGYWAPEMLQRNEDGSRIRYNLAVDWFSLGCVLYQFMSGVCPFRKIGENIIREGTRNGHQIKKEVAMDQAVVKMHPPYPPELFTDDASDLIQKLLDKNQKTRLGAQGAEEVMAHPYFSEVNWEEFEDDTVKPPCLPRKDLNYATQNEIGAFALEDQQGTEILPADREIFDNWSYTRQTAFLEEAVSYMTYEAERGPIQIEASESMCCTIS